MADDLELQIAAGLTAKRLAEDEMFKEACRQVRKKSAEAWMNTNPDQSELREAEYHKLQALKGIEKELAVIQGNGDVAGSQLKTEIGRRMPPARATRNN